MTFTKSSLLTFLKEMTIQNGALHSVCANISQKKEGFIMANIPNWPVLGNGSSGVNVTALQCLLYYHGFNISVDGIFGNGTAAAVTTIMFLGSSWRPSIIVSTLYRRLVLPTEWVPIKFGAPVTLKVRTLIHSFRLPLMMPQSLCLEK